MQPEDKNPCNQFEIEVWLYISKELNDERRKMWDSHIKQCAGCNQLLESNKEISSFYTENMTEDILDSVFEKAIEKATTRLSFREKIKYHVADFAKSFAFGKIVLGSTLVAAAIIIMFLTHTPNPVKQIADSITKWDDTAFASKIDEISESISALNHNSNKAETEWAKSVEGIENKLDSLKNFINK